MPPRQRLRTRITSPAHADFGHCRASLIACRLQNVGESAVRGPRHLFSESNNIRILLTSHSKASARMYSHGYRLRRGGPKSRKGGGSCCN